MIPQDGQPVVARQRATDPREEDAGRDRAVQTPEFDPWSITSPERTSERTRVLKDEDTFGVFDTHGDVRGGGLGEQGLYHQGTRFLSRFALTVNGRRPVLLNSWIRSDNSLLVIDMTTADLSDEGGDRLVAADTIHLFRARFLREGALYEHLRIVSYALAAVPLTISFALDADYADIFEVRGTRRAARGRLLPVQRGSRSVVLGYRGLDGVVRRTHVEFDRDATEIGETAMRFARTLRPGEEYGLHLSVCCEIDQVRAHRLPYVDALERCAGEAAHSRAQMAAITTSNEQFNAWLERSAADLHMLVTQTDAGPYPFAGVPWFSTPFGRDGIITALQVLWAYPDLARGVLGFLAVTQAENSSAEQDAEPGKIVHEIRRGEMPALGEVPFGRYYGSVDSTPLFVILTGAWWDRTGDRASIERLWPHVRRALEWIDRHGDVDGDGFVEYSRRRDTGLLNQGWRDSGDALFHRDGSAAEGPIALVEVQGYVYEAKLAAARLARMLGDEAFAAALETQAVELRRRFDAAFWCDELETYAMALDGRKRPCRVRSSAAGHALTTGIADPARAPLVARTLLSEHSYSGWGVRTVAAGERRYNPMSYHNGSLWPHDNAMVALGLARYSRKSEALRIMSGLFDASRYVDLNRLPELFCGFARQPAQGPTLYPVACSPQAWASGAVYQLLQACLGLRFSPEKPQITFDHPLLPDYLDRIRIDRLAVASASVDLMLNRHGSSVSVHVTRKHGDVEVAIRV